MTDLTQLLIQPFADHDYMRRALVTCLALALGSAPLGVFLALRRLTMLGDAMSHAILPGVAVAFMVSGGSVLAMTLGGLIAGVLVAVVAITVTRLTPVKEDASFTAMFLISLALGTLLLSLRGESDELLHALFGNIFTISDASLTLILSICSITLAALAVIYRGLIVECFDPLFLRSVRGHGALYHLLFMTLVAFGLVGTFQAMGTLTGLGLMILPAITTRLWTRTVDAAIALSIGLTLLTAVAGLLTAYHTQSPSGPVIVLVAGGIYLLSILFGRVGGLFTMKLPHHHYAD